MIVVKKLESHHVCIPIFSYGGSGIAKRGLSHPETRAHSVVHELPCYQRKWQVQRVHTQADLKVLVSANDLTEPEFVLGRDIRLCREGNKCRAIRLSGEPLTREGIG